MSLNHSFSNSGRNVKSETPDSSKDLRSLIEKKDGQIERLLEENKQLIKQKDSLERSLSDITTSRSWRLTSFFRSIMSGLRAIFPIYRSRSYNCSFRPGRNVEAKGEGFSIRGISPTVYLEVRGNSTPRGWVELNAEIEADTKPFFALLYFGLNGDYNPVNRTWLTFEEGQCKGHVFRIPEWATELRLDPFESHGEFRIKSFLVREIGKAQVLLGILGKQLKPVLLHPPLLWSKFVKFFSLIRSGGLQALRIRLFAADYTSNYQEWVRQYDTIDDNDRRLIKAAIEKLDTRPLISVLMPVYNVEERWLRAAIQSVQKQLYENWELCIADDSSSAPHVKLVLQEYASADSRIKVVYREENGHISRASNSALEIASGDYVALLDHDDEITEDALFQIVQEINNNPAAGLIYSDEDKLTSYGMRFNPYFKPNWNPELFLVQNYICHLAVYRADLLREIGGFRTGFEGAQDWDLALRVIEKLKPEQVCHIPHVLYHWRVIEGSTAQATSFKPYVMEAQKRAVSEHLERTNTRDARVEILPAISHLRVKYSLPQSLPRVSIIMPTRDKLEILQRCVESLYDKTNYSNYELIIVDNGSVEEKTLAYFEKLKANRGVRILRDENPFNFSRLNNQAANHAQGELLGFLNNDLEVINPDWLNEMVALALRPGVGAVGARLLFPNGALQHGGVVLGIGGIAGHSHKGRPRQDPGYFNCSILTRVVSAVTAACMILSAKIFKQVGGFDEDALAVAFNDVDLCLKVRQAGFRNLYCAEAELFHHESVSRGYENTPQKFTRFEREIGTMKSRWKSELQSDPFYNPNLTLLTEDYAFAFPPRCHKPWRSQ